MPKAIQMTPDRAMRAIAMLRDALASVKSGELSEGALLMIVHNECWPVALDDADIAAATAEMDYVTQTEEWKLRSIEHNSRVPQDWNPRLGYEAGLQSAPGDVPPDGWSQEMREMWFKGHQFRMSKIDK